MIAYIYSLINTKTNLRYVGKTINFETRLKTHLRMLHNHSHHSTKLQRAWDKYGEEYFTWEVKLINCSLEELNELEKLTILQYDSYLNGYNETLGGEGSGRYNFTFEEYCFIKIGNTTFEAMFNLTAKYFKCDDSVISDIVHNITYIQYLEKFLCLSKELKQEYLNLFIAEFNIDIFNPPKILNRKKVDDYILAYCLCIMQFHDKVGKTLEEIHGYAKGTMSSLKRGVRYPTAWSIYNNWTDEERKLLSDYYYLNWQVLDKALLRLLKQGGAAVSYTLSQDDFNFAFTAQELGYKAPIIAKYFKIKESTVYDWFNHRSRNREYQIFLNLSNDEKSRLIGCVKTAELSGNPKLLSSN